MVSCGSATPVQTASAAPRHAEEGRRKEGRTEDAFGMKNPQLESTKRRNLNEMQQPVARSAAGDKGDEEAEAEEVRVSALVSTKSGFGDGKKEGRNEV